ncbi:MAG TPA: hypothetical protein VF406_09630 [Thermodesulfobacteriota bacterium]
MKRSVTAIAFALALAMADSPALAFHCPKDIAANNEAISAAEKRGVAADKIAEARRLNDEALKLHQAGKHQESIDTAAKVKGVLGS